MDMETESPDLREMSVDSKMEFGEFYAANRDQLYRGVALVVQDPSRALDAVDEALARAWERWDQIGAYTRPEAWVYRVAINYAVSAHRKTRREERTAETPLAVHVDPVPEVELSAAIDRLSLKHRSVIVARFFLDLSVGETAYVLDVSQGTVKSRTSRALARLARELGAQ
jgi:RNA polymerase sigma-70 factor (sigma-E family)